MQIWLYIILDWKLFTPAIPHINPITLVLSTDTPTIIVPSVPKQCVQPGLSRVQVSWEEVTATNADNQDIECTDSYAGTTDLTRFGGTFRLG